MYSVVFPQPRSTPRCIMICCACQLLGVSFFDRPRPRRHDPPEGMPLRRTPAPGQLPPEAAGRPRGSARGVRLPTELLLRSGRLPQAGDTAVGAVSRSEGLPRCRGHPGRGHAARADRHGGSASFPSSSAPTGGPSPAGRSSGGSTFPRHRSGRSHAVVWCRRSRSSPPSPGAAGGVPPRPRSDPAEGWKRLLRFLSPITITGGLAIEISR